MTARLGGPSLNLNGGGVSPVGPLPEAEQTRFPGCAFAGRSPVTAESPPGPGLGRAVEERGLALADADAERREPVAAVAAPELVQECHDEAGAAPAQRGARRERAGAVVHARPG